MNTPTPHDRILFYDGLCGLCDRFVVFVLSRARVSGCIFLAPLQGSTAEHVLEAKGGDPLQTVIYWRTGKMYVRAQAVEWVLYDLGGVWRLFAMMMRVVPRVLANRLYDFVARHRYRVFGMRAACRLPTESEQQRFLP